MNLDTKLPYHFSIGKIDESFSYKTKCDDCFVIYFFSEAKGTCSVDFETFDLLPKGMLLLAPKQVLQLEAENLSGYYLSFDLNFYHLVKSNLKLYDFPFFHITSSEPKLSLGLDFEAIESLFVKIEKEFSSDISFGKWTILRYELEILLVQLTRIKQKQLGEEKTLLTPNNERLRKLESLIELHFKENKEVSFYADQLHISSRHLNNIIKEVSGKSISQILQHRLLVESKRLLMITEKSVSEIAYDLGFNDKAYFHRFFKKYTELTPLQFREDFRKVHH